MLYKSKLSIVDEKIDFLERKLFEYSKIIDELATSFEKLKFSLNKKSIQAGRENIFESHIKHNIGSFVFF